MMINFSARSRQGGFSLFSAIFLLVMLSALGAAIVKVSSSSQIASALDIQGERAYQGARAGIEWGLHRQLKNQSCMDSTSFALPAGTVLASFTVTVSCEIGHTDKIFASTLISGSAAVSDVQDSGMLKEGVTVSGTGIPAGTTVLSAKFDGDIRSTLTLSNPATMNGVQDIRYRFEQYITHTLKSTACNQPSATGACPHEATSNHPDYVQRVLEVRF